MPVAVFGPVTEKRRAKWGCQGGRLSTVRGLWPPLPLQPPGYATTGATFKRSAREEKKKGREREKREQRESEEGEKRERQEETRRRTVLGKAPLRPGANTPPQLFCRLPSSMLSLTPGITLPGTDPDKPDTLFTACPSCHPSKQSPCRAARSPQISHMV